MKRPNKKARRIVVDGREYWWMVSARMYGCVIWDDTGNKHITEYDVFGLGGSEVIRKKMPVKPSDVECYIRAMAIAEAIRGDDFA